MSAKLRTIRIGAWLALGMFAMAAAMCPGAQSYRPVFGDPMREQWRWRTFPELSGLDVLCMAEGSDGTKWFGTANGLWSYDGFDWVRHDEGVGRIVTTLCRRADGTLFAAGGWGVSQLANGKWSEVISVSRARLQSLSDVPIRKLAFGRDGSLWVATRWGVLCWREGPGKLYTDAAGAARAREDPKLAPFTIELLPESATATARGGRNAGRFEVTDVFIDALGRVWVGTGAGRVMFREMATAGAERETWSVYDLSRGSVAGGVTSIAQMQDGTIWVVRADTDAADLFDGHAWRTTKLPLSLPVLDLDDAGGRVMQTRDGVVWLAGRFLLFAWRDGRWHQYGLPDLPYPSIRNVVLQAADGALWFAGPNSEVHRVDYQTSRWVTLEDLNFQWESPSGVQWFLHRSGRVVRRDGNEWISYGVEDGLIDTPVALLGTRSGAVWAAGSHEHTAATARFADGKWTLETHPNFSFAIDWRAIFEASDGSVWFGAFVDTYGPPQHRDGLLQFRNGTWIHHHQPGRSPRPDGAENPATLLPRSSDPDRLIEKFTSIGESADGKIWAGRSILAFYDGGRWAEFSPVSQSLRVNIEAMLTTRGRDLWIGTREVGALRFDGRQWHQFHASEGFPANSVRSLTETFDGSIWAMTDRGSARFDGNSWMGEVLPEALDFPHEGGALVGSASGRLWINRFTLYWMRRAWSKSPPPEPGAGFRTVCYDFRGPAPRTKINAGASVISQPGNLAVLWSGAMPWREAKDARLQFSFRLDNQPWSPFTSDRGHSFFTLPPGAHRLEVRARDADFNVDSTPATFDFVVLPPVWRQGWFIGLMLVLGGLVVAQSIRVLLEQGRLRRAHDELENRVRQRTAELETANRDLAASNRELEAFSYSVSHDLRAPLRSIDGFSKALIEDYAEKLDDEGRDDLQRVRVAAQRMGQLIDDMLKLSRVARSELRRAPVDLSALVKEILRDHTEREPVRKVRLAVAPSVVVEADGNLVRIALENLLGNAWKFTSRRDVAQIEFGVADRDGEPVFFVRDNGAGFDMANAGKLFGAFQRFHLESEFPGTGVGLAIVQRIVLRHGGRVWAESEPERGATFYFTLSPHIASPPPGAGRGARPT